MIRIELGRPRGRGRARAALGVAVAAAGVFAGLFLLDRRVPMAGAWQRLRTQADGGSPPALAVDVAPAPAATAAGAATAPRPLPAPEAPAAAPAQLPRSDSCARVLALVAQLPEAAGVGSVACDGGGDFEVEGLCPDPDLPALEGAVDSLRRVGGDASLTYWRAGDAAPDSRFHLRGRAPGEGRLPLAPLSPDEARQVLTEVDRQLTASALVSLGASTDAAHTAGGGLRHYETTGSFAQVQRFLGALTPMRDRVRVQFLAMQAARQEGSARDAVFSHIDIAYQPREGGDP